MKEEYEFLTRQKQEIEEAKPEINRLEGKISSLMETLKEQYNCESEEDLEQLIFNTEEEIENLEDDLEKGIEKLKDEYGIED